MVGGVALVSLVPSAFALQPAMQSAMDNLNDAERNLQNATNDKGGHRNKALRLVRDAQREVKAGIRLIDDIDWRSDSIGAKPVKTKSANEIRRRFFGVLPMSNHGHCQMTESRIRAKFVILTSSR